MFFDGLLVVDQLLIVLEEIGELQNVAGHLDPIARRDDDFFNRWSLVDSPPRLQ